MSTGNVQLNFQREFFDPLGEQILAFLPCSSLSNQGQEQAKKNKRTSKDITRDMYLVLVNRQQPFQISLVDLRGGSANEVAKKKRTWLLKELTAVDAKNEKLSFELEFGKEPKSVPFQAQNLEEKNKFLSTLINLSLGHGSQLRLDNLPSDIVVVSNLKNPGDGRSDRSSFPILNSEEADSYEAISTKEAKDLMELMEKCEHAVTNADIFVDDLSRELNLLDGENIHSIMTSEENIENLMGTLETAIMHTESIEKRLNHYDELLEHIRDSMDKMEGKTVSIEMVNMNNKKLLECLETLLTQLDLSYRHQNALQEADFSTSKKLKECIVASKALKRVLTAEIDPNLTKMKAVQDQVKRCEKIREKFAKSIFRHLNNLFVHWGNDSENLASVSTMSVSTSASVSGQMRLKRRNNIHKDLMKYAELVHWMKSMDHKSFLSLQKIYRENLCKLYEKDIKRFFDNARYHISGGKALQPVAGSTSDLSGGKKGPKSTTLGAGSGLLGTDADSINSDMSLSERERFDDVMETVLLELEDICMDEQYFSSNFFQMEQIDCNNKDPKEVKRVLEVARNMMAEIFPELENELLQFLSFYERSDSFFTLHALVRLSKHVLSTQNTGSFLAISFGTVLVQVKRNFDKFMQIQQKSIEESKVPRRPKCGILPFISNFENFVKTTEAIFKSSDRRSDLEKWYAILVNEMCQSINKLSMEHPKTPSEVVKMENFHHLHALLSQMKIQALDAQKKEIKTKYVEAQKNYVTRYFGRPLENLNVFFEGIQQLVNAGVKESEISYQLAFSKQELRKVISHYPGKEVKKGLESLYKKVERHLCEEENLNQVVWRAMQEEFIIQYKNIEDLIQRCYPGSQICLDFTINEILEYFSDIARSH